MSLTVLIPVLDRPDRVEPLLESLSASEAVLELIPVFLCTLDDAREIAAVERAGMKPRVVPWSAGQADYARKMNLGFREAKTEWVFLAADDLCFHSGWATRAIEHQRETGACVVGTNDLGNSLVISGKHSTHTLVHRGYGDCGSIDDPRFLLHEGYHHNWVDTEFVETALSRGMFSAARDSIVEHLHPVWGKGEEDATYRKGKERYHDDRRLFEERRRLWRP